MKQKSKQVTLQSQHNNRRTSYIWLHFILISFVAIVLCVVAAKWLDRPIDYAAKLSDQIHLVSSGKKLDNNIFGGRIWNINRKTVVTEKIPPKYCVEVGWILMKHGTLTVNGVTPIHVTPSKLSVLCHIETTATMSWTPDNE